MTELLRALQLGGICWKKLAPYNIKCRKTVQVAKAPPGSAAMSDDEGDKLDGMDAGSPTTTANAHVSPEPASSQPQQHTVEAELKFECQMYKIREDEYMIDIQRLTGDLFLYMDVAGRLLNQMRV